MSKVAVLLKKKFFPEKRVVNGAHIYTVQQVVESENKKKQKVEKLLSLSEDGIKILQADETPDKSFAYGQIIKFKTEPKQNIWGFTASEDKKSMEYLFYTKQVWDIRDSNATFVELNLKKKGREGEFRKKMEAQNVDAKLPYKFSQGKSTDSNSNTNTNTNISDDDSTSLEMEDLSERSEKRNSPKKAKINTGNDGDNNKVGKQEEKTSATEQVDDTDKAQSQEKKPPKERKESSSDPQPEKMGDITTVPQEANKSQNENKEQDKGEDQTKKEVKKERTKRKSKKPEDNNDEAQTKTQEEGKQEKDS